MTPPAYSRPSVLPRGATLAVVSPASTPKPERVRRGIERLEAMGYSVILGRHALDRGPLYYAGTVADRVQDLHAAFADARVDGVLCTRGGWGSAELLPHLDIDLIRSRPKPFVGYSDHTSLHIWLQQQAGLVTFHGPMVAADFARDGGVDEVSWAASLEVRSKWAVGPAEGLRVLRGGTAHGVLRGGCLAIIAEACGTPYSLQPAGGILFLEDIGVKPYQWDRMLLHLRYAGLFHGITGVVFGDMRQCVAPGDEPLLEQAILHGLGDFAGPVAIGLRSGHVDGANVTLPLGAQVELDLTQAQQPRMWMRDSGGGFAG